MREIGQKCSNQRVNNDLKDVGWQARAPVLLLMLAVHRWTSQLPIRRGIENTAVRILCSMFR